VKFYFVRGDSARIPADLAAAPDSAVWYIDRWEDQTAPGGGSSVLDATWAGLKARYRRLW